jgi:hypothetical protein
LRRSGSGTICRRRLRRTDQRRRVCRRPGPARRPLVPVPPRFPASKRHPPPAVGSGHAGTSATRRVTAAPRILGPRRHLLAVGIPSSHPAPAHRCAAVRAREPGPRRATPALSSSRHAEHAHAARCPALPPLTAPRRTAGGGGPRSVHAVSCRASLPTATAGAKPRHRGTHPHACCQRGRQQARRSVSPSLPRFPCPKSKPGAFTPHPRQKRGYL